MKRLHLHVVVDDLSKSISFYSTLFGAEPHVVKEDYAKWMLEDPRVNFAISNRARAAGLDHLGIQVDTADELNEIASRLKAAGGITRDEEAATCCYARSDKAWVNDPSGLSWETFYTFGDSPVYGEGEQPLAQTNAACCAPSAKSTQTAACC